MRKLNNFLFMNIHQNFKRLYRLQKSLIFLSEILPEVNESWPKRIGNRTNEFFMNCVCCFDLYNIQIKRRTAFDPISMAAYFLILMNKIYFYNTQKSQIEILWIFYHFLQIHFGYPDLFFLL